MSYTKDWLLALAIASSLCFSLGSGIVAAQQTCASCSITNICSSSEQGGDMCFFLEGKCYEGGDDCGYETFSPVTSLDSVATSLGTFRFVVVSADVAAPADCASRVIQLLLATSGDRGVEADHVVLGSAPFGSPRPRIVTKIAGIIGSLVLSGRPEPR
jgi:hypothetical protein